LPFAVLFALVSLVAFGTPLLKLAYEYLPGFRFSRVDRAGYFLILCQFVMAAFAARSLGEDKAGVMRKVFGGAVVLLFAATYFWVRARAPYMPYDLGSMRALPPPASLAPEQAAAIVARTQTAALFAGGTALAFFLPAGRIAAALPFVLAAAQLFQAGIPYRGLRDAGEILRDDPAITELRAKLDAGDAGGGRFARFGRDAGGFYTFSSVIPPSTNVPFALRDVQGYNALSPRGLGDALERATGENLFSHGLWTGRRIVEPEQSRSIEHPIFDALSTRVIVSHLPPGQAESPRAKGWTFASRNGFFAWENGEFLPRARLVSRGAGVTAEVLAGRVQAGDFDPAVEVIWAGEGALSEPAPAAAPAPSSDADEGSAQGARVVEDEWNRVTVEVDADRENYLVLADSYDPGWKATIDGEPAPVLAAYGLVRAVRMPAGTHTVRFTYEPNSFRLGGALSLAGLAILATLTVRSHRARRIHSSYRAPRTGRSH
ncbi:MAG: YfhO family protein, partial [Gemmatimonadetes bacterium]|nr:YfhO family protein [Gemmatimonadota bacterium]